MFKSTHNLPFEGTDWLNLEDEIVRILDKFNAIPNIRRFLASITDLSKGTPKVQLFRIGSCSGVWYPAPTEYRILFIGNSKKGNGHFEDVLEWFAESCRRDKKALVFEEVLMTRFRKHLIEKRGFVRRKNDCIKYYNS